MARPAGPRPGVPDRDEADHDLDLFTLTFKSAKVEQRYLRDNMTRVMPLMRISLFSAAVIYGLFAILDRYLMPDAFGIHWTIRFGVVCPLLLFTMAATYSPYFLRVSQVLLTVCMGGCGLGIVLMIALAPPPINDTSYAGLIMVVFYGAVLVRLRFVNAAATTLVVLAAYEFVVLLVNPLPTKALVSNNFFLLLVSIMGLFGTYLQDLFIRRNWATTQMLMRGRELLAESEAANTAKSEFLAIVSHELRTPLNAIIGFSEFLKMEMFGPLGSERYKSYAKDIFDSGKHLLEIINDILDLSRAEANKLKLIEEEVVLRAVIESNLRMFAKSAAAVGVRLSLEDGPMPVLFADERLLTQAITNLLSNAIKFSDRGGSVSVAVRLAEGGQCDLVVSDTGIGIAPENIAKVMEPFVQVESSHSRHHDGLGLGLPLVKRIAELHAGELVIESALGVGTTVTVRLPRDRVLRWEGMGEQPLAAAG